MTASQKSESNRITDLVSWLRISAAGSLDPHVGQAADAIELLQRELKCSKEMWEQQQELALEYLADIEKANERIEELELPLCIGQRTIGIMAEEGCWKSEDGRAVIAADELFRQDPYARIAELEAALKPFANVTPVLQEDDHGVIYEWALNCDDIRQARKALGDNK